MTSSPSEITPSVTLLRSVAVSTVETITLRKQLALTSDCILAVVSLTALTVTCATVRLEGTFRCSKIAYIPKRAVFWEIACPWACIVGRVGWVVTVQFRNDTKTWLAGRVWAVYRGNTGGRCTSVGGGEVVAVWASWAVVVRGTSDSWTLKFSECVCMNQSQDQRQTDKAQPKFIYSHL